jgi:Homeodomain-like domain
MPYIIGKKPTRKNKFLNELAQGWSVSKAAVAAGISRSQAYRWRETDLKFAATWDEAIEVA